MPDNTQPNLSPYAMQIPSFNNYIIPPTFGSTSASPPLPPEVPATGTGNLFSSALMSSLHEAKAEGWRALQAGAQLAGATDTAQTFSDYADQAHATAQSYANPEYENAPWYSPSGIAYRLTQMVPTTAAALGAGALATVGAPETAAGVAALTGVRALLGGAARRAVLGGAAAMYPFATGENVQRQINETGELTTPGKALALGVPEAVLQGWLPGRLEKYFAQGILAGVRHGAIAQSIAAGGTEAMTGLMGDPDRGFADRAGDITRQALSGGLLGGLAGGVFSGMRSLVAKPAADTTNADMIAATDPALKSPRTTATVPLPHGPQLLQLPPPEGAPAGPRIEATEPPMVGGAPVQEMSPAKLWGLFTDVISHLAVNPQDRAARGDAEILRAEVLRRAAEGPPVAPPAAEAPPAAPTPTPGAPPAAAPPVPPEVAREALAAAPAAEPPAVVAAPKGPVAPVGPAAVAAPAVPAAPVIDFTTGKVSAGKALYDVAPPDVQAEMRKPLIASIGDKEARGVQKRWGNALDILTSDGKVKPELRPAEPAPASPAPTPEPAPAAPTRKIVRDPVTGKFTLQGTPETRVKDAVDQISAKLADQEKAAPAASDDEAMQRALQAMKEFAATPEAREPPTPIEPTVPPAAPAAEPAPAPTPPIGAMTVKQLKDHITNVLGETPKGRVKQELIQQIMQRRAQDAAPVAPGERIQYASAGAQRQRAEPAPQEMVNKGFATLEEPKAALNNIRMLIGELPNPEDRNWLTGELANLDPATVTNRQLLLMQSRIERAQRWSPYNKLTDEQLLSMGGKAARTGNPMPADMTGRAAELYQTGWQRVTNLMATESPEQRVAAEKYYREQASAPALISQNVVESGIPDFLRRLPRGPNVSDVASHHMPWYERGLQNTGPRGGNEAEQAAWDRGAQDRALALKAKEAPVETTADRTAALSDTAEQIGKIKDPALQKQFSDTLDSLSSQLQGADRNRGYAPKINKKIMELRTTVENVANPQADHVAPPGLPASPRAEAVSAPAGDLDDRLTKAQLALSSLRKAFGPRRSSDVGAALDQHEQWLIEARKSDDPKVVLAKDPEALAAAETPGVADLGGLTKLSTSQREKMNTYLNAQQQVLQELRAQAGSRARVISSRDGLPVTQLDADVTDMHQRGVKSTDIADHIIENSASPEEAELMAKLRPFIREDETTVFRDGVTDKEGEYFPGTKTTALYNAADATRTFIHEMVHATLSRALEGDSAAARAMRGIYEQLKSKGDNAGVTDAHEMVAEAFANPAYRDFLKSQVIKGTSLWSRFIDAARRFIGLDPRLYNAFDRIMSLGDDLMKEQQAYPNDAWVGRDSFARVTDKAANDTATAATIARSALEQRLAAGRLNMTDRMRGVAFGLLNSQRFAPLYAKFAPSIAEKIKLEQQHAALDSALSRPIQLANRLGSKVHGDDLANLNKTMDDASFFELDPRKELSTYEEIHDNPDLVNRFNENKARYNALSPEAKVAYEAQRANGSMNIHALMALRLQSVMRAMGIPFTDAFDVYRNNDRLWDNPQLAERHFKDAVTAGVKTVSDYVTTQSADLATIKATLKTDEKAKAAAAKAGTTGQVGLSDDQLEKMEAQSKELQTNISKAGSVLNDVKKQQIQVDKAPYFHRGRIGDKFLTAKLITDDDGNVDQKKLAQFADHLEKAGFKDIGINQGGQNDTFYTRVESASRLDQLRQTIQDAQAKGLLSKDGAAWGEANTMYSTLSKNAYGHVVEELLAHRVEPPEGLSDELVANWKDATTHQANELRRTLLNLLPENSMGRQMAQRRNVQGYNTNMLQNNLAASRVMTRGLAHMAFAPDMGAVSARMLDDVKNVNRTQDTNTALAVGQAVNELMLRDQVKQSSFTPLALAEYLHGLTHTLHIGLSPPYVFMLMSQIMTTAWPELAKTHGLGGSAAALFKVEGDAFKVIRAIMGSEDRATVGVSRAVLEKAGLPQARIDQVMRAVANGVMDTAMYSTQAHGQSAINPTIKAGWEVANAMGKYAELFPRLSTLFAAHDLYKAKPVEGMSAEDFAHGAVTESQGDWTPGLSARQTSRGGVAGRLSPLVLQFMGWRVIMTGKMYNEVRDAFKGDAGAQRWLLGHAAATTMLAGTLGLPALSAAAGVYDKLMNWVTDRDDHDLTASYRNFLSDTFGKDMGEIIARGLPRAAGMDFPRFSEADIIPGTSVINFATEKRKLEDQERDWAKSLVGPAVGDMFNAASAARDFTNGDILNGMIKLLPEVGKAPLETYRLSKYGFINNLTGQKLPIASPTTQDYILTMLGIDPGKEAEYNEVRRDATGMQTMRQLSSENIVRHMELAYTRRDPAMMNTWQAESQKWQAEHPGLMPPAMSFQRALQNHQRQSAIAQGYGLPVGVRPQDIDVRRALRYGNIGQQPQ